ncbi:hypothetical protein BKA62DRAFT_696490, partial [Auriculariales sp. MPI-PUGE-AT-0066]
MSLLVQPRCISLSLFLSLSPARDCASALGFPRSCCLAASGCHALAPRLDGPSCSALHRRPVAHSHSLTLTYPYSRFCLTYSPSVFSPPESVSRIQSRLAFVTPVHLLSLSSLHHLSPVSCLPSRLPGARSLSLSNSGPPEPKPLHRLL